MARTRTPDAPDLSALQLPRTPLTVAVENALLRGAGAQASASIAEQVAARLAGAITLGHLRAGQRLLEADLGEAMGVSRAPVREALRILERDRLVEFKPRRGAIVTSPDADELRDIFAVRSALYSMLLAQAMDESPEALAAVFDRHLPRLKRASGDGVDAYALEGFLLNDAVFDLCRNRLLADMLKSISLRTLRYVRMGLAGSTQAIPKSLRTWAALRRAIDGGRVADVLDVARGRMDDTRESAVRALSAQQRAARGAGQATELSPP
jgi:DNA-binding GntR family transcriptional regulator